MKYLLLDTNIYLDMIIDRKNNVSNKLLESFIKLLDYKEITLVVPSIVKYETNKHIKEQLNEVGNNIDRALDSIKNIYGINGYSIEGLKVKTYKDNTRKELTKLREYFESNKENYLEEIENLIDKLFSHENSIIIPEEKIITSCFLRRTYKKAPFHHESKDCYADGIIVETLLNISEYVTINEGDMIYFVSGNTSDFSDSNIKVNLHNDIILDLKNLGMDNIVKYILRFNQLVAVELKNEVENANLKEEFEKELKEQENLFYSDMKDMERNSIGLQSLSHYESYFEECFYESGFSNNVISLFERLEKCYTEIEELYLFYSDEFQSFVMNYDCKKIQDFVGELCVLLSIDEDECTINTIMEILDVIDSKIKAFDYSDIDIGLPDSLEYGNDIEFYGKNKEKYILEMDPLLLTPDDGGSDSLELRIVDNKKNNIANANIEINYGYVEFNDEGNVGDACDEEITYNFDYLVEKLEEIVDGLETIVREESALRIKLETFMGNF